MDYLEYKGYKGSVEYSKDDNCLLEGIESYLDYCKEEGIEPAKPYSGKLNLRMPSELHSRVAAFVASTGITINDFINRAITNELKKVAAL